MRIIASLAVLACAAIGCTRSTPLILCHNSNCAEPQDPSRDDTAEGLEASLALTGEDGLPVIDGVEMDMLLHDGRCLFAHDAAHAASSIELTEAAQIVAEHLRSNLVASHDGTQFTLELELKADPGEPALAAKVDCALAGYAIVRDAAHDVGYQLDVMFVSYSPALLRAVHERRPADPGVTTKLVLGVGVPQPLLDDNHLLSELGDLAVDVAEIHPGWITETELEALRSDYQLGLWFFDATTEMLQSIDQINPSYVLTGQARSVRSWLTH